MTDRVVSLTFVLTDVEDSTEIWEIDPAAMHKALAEHDRVIEAAVVSHGGQLIRSRGEGDGRFAIFEPTSAAIGAALDIQVSMQRLPWPTSRPLRVRIGVHVGEAEWRDGDLYGTAVNRCARLRNSGHGGQVLVSAVAAATPDVLPAGAGFRDLGAFRLKGVPGVQRVFQLVHEALDNEFPPLRLPASRVQPLPVSTTRFIGREKEVTEICALLHGDVRALTLLGPGGVGKTRLALRAAETLQEELENGVNFVDLSSLAQPELIPATIANAFGIRESGFAAVEQTLAAFLRERKTLLILDNLEHLISGVNHIAALLQACPEVKILGTSRVPLHIAAERIYRVSTMDLPTTAAGAALPSAAPVDSVALFVERAPSVAERFQLTPDNFAVVSAICRCVDGLPLAIELAAARLLWLTPERLLDTLTQHSRLLSGGASDAPARHRTLRNAIAWSYELLNPDQQAVFDRVAVFAGGFDLAGAEAVFGDAMAGNVAQGIDILMEASLLNCSADGRFRMLETVREFAFDQLRTKGGLESARIAHARYFLQLAEAAEEPLLGQDWKKSYQLLEAEIGNFRLAYTWALEHRDADAALRMAGALWRFFYANAAAEGKRLVENAFSIADAAVKPAVRAKALLMAGVMQFCHGDFLAARAALKQSAELWRSVGDDRGLCRTLGWLGSTYKATAPPFEPFMAEALAIGRRIGDIWGLSCALYWRGFKAITIHNLGAARPALEELVRIQRSVREPYMFSTALDCIGGLEELAGNDPAAATYYAEALSLARQVGYGAMVGSAAAGLGGVAFRGGDVARAKALFEDGLNSSLRAGFAPAMWRNLRGIALARAANQEFESAAILFGASDAMRTPEDVQTHTYFDAVREHTRQSLGSDAFEARLREGALMTAPEAVAYAIKPSAFSHQEAM